MTSVEKKVARCFYDLEATALTAESGFIVGFGILDENNTFHHAFLQGSVVAGEKELCGDNIKLLSQYRSVVTHYGRQFDFPMLISRSLLHGLDPSPILRVNHIDTWEIARQRLCLKHCTLDDLAKFFNIPKNTTLRGSDMPILYMKAVQDDKLALQQIKNHCLDDLQVLAKVFYRLKPIIGATTYNAYP
jgi:uncharacterized protein YprB with RNaseH-like and TPR domain